MIGPPIGLVHGHSSHSIESCSSTSGHGHCIRITNAHRRHVVEVVCSHSQTWLRRTRQHMHLLYIFNSTVLHRDLLYITITYASFRSLSTEHGDSLCQSKHAAASNHQNSLQSSKSIPLPQLHKKRNRIIKHEA